MTKLEAVKLALYVAQYHYYEFDDPIMSDSTYDQLEKKYERLGGVLDTVGCAGNLEKFLRGDR